MLGKKQRSQQSDWIETLTKIDKIISREAFEQRVEETLEDMRRVIGSQHVAFGWSGGKDSQVLRFLMERLGQTECVLVICNLEYPAFLRWATDHMPDDLTIINTDQDLPWLIAHPDWLFPQTAAQAARWFAAVQHRGQIRYFRQAHLDMLILGRRLADGNVCGSNSSWITQTRQGIIRYHPLATWTHEEILAAIYYEHLALPPNYQWPRGFQVGTGPWPARQWITSELEGWKEVYYIDPDIIRTTAKIWPRVATVLHQIERE